MISALQIGWLAGIIEGEGCIVIPNKPGKSLQVAIGMNDKDVVNQVAKLFGSNLRGPYKKKVVRHKPSWAVSAQGKRAAGILMTVYALMGKRRKAAIRKGLSLWKKQSMPNKDKTSCPRGHPYSGKNLYIYKKTGQRFCVACNNR